MGGGWKSLTVSSYMLSFQHISLAQNREEITLGRRFHVPRSNVIRVGPSRRPSRSCCSLTGRKGLQAEKLCSVLLIKTAKLDKGGMADQEQQQPQPDTFVLRPLEAADYHKGYLQLLQQLTTVGEISEEAFAGRVEHLQKLGANHHVAVIEDVVRKKIVATGSILVEYKFVRNCGKAGHIEDVVVDNSVRGQHLGLRIVEFLTTFAEEAGCYKVILDCSTENETFYEKCGMSRKGIQMAKYF
jgi:glucosamine-phosphate N-acetyltransferase